MQLSSTTWYGISVVCLVGAIYFWWLGNQPPVTPGGTTNSPPAFTNSPDNRNRPAGDHEDQPGPPSYYLAQPQGAAPLLSAATPSNALATPLSPPPSPAAHASPYRLSNTPEPPERLVRRDSALLLQNALLDTARPLDLSIPPALRPAGDPGSYLVQARGPVNDRFRQYLAAAGAQIIAYIPNNAYLVRASAVAADKLAGAPLTQAVLPWQPYFKLEPALLQTVLEFQPMPADERLNVVLFPTDTLPDLGLHIIAQDRTPFGPMLTVLAPGPGLVAELARRPEVQTIERHRWRQPANDLTRTRVTAATDVLASTNYLGLTGQGVLVHVVDEGGDIGHPDLAPRVYTEPGTSAAVGDYPGHGTHVIGTIISSGANGPTNAFSTNAGSYRGIASSASVLLMPFATNGLVAGQTNRVQVPDSYLQERAALSNAFISNNSWGFDDNPSYDIHAASFDLAVRDALPGVSNSQPLCIVFAAGNAGEGGTDGRGGLAGTINSPATAKNVITVGAIENARNITNEFEIDGETGAYFEERTDSNNEVAEFSSRGNVGLSEGEGIYGRFKPDVVAPGAMVISTRPRNWTHPDTNIATLDAALGATSAAPYGYENGTSMATAAVSGLLALMQEYFEQQRSLTNSPALMKALLINGARSLKPTYDYRVNGYVNYQGWGLVNLTNSLSPDLTPTPGTATSMFLVDQSPTNTLATGQTQTWTLTVSSNARTAPLRVTLVWTDPPGHPSASLVKLVNNLDLQITALTTLTNGTIQTNLYVGNNFPSGAVYTSPSPLASTNSPDALAGVRDVVNNVENIYLVPPLADTYQISVAGARVHVNAVTANTNDVVQDFALVISSDNRAATGLTVAAPTLTANRLANVATLTQLTNGLPYFKQKERVGANPPLSTSTNGALNQWNFYEFQVGAGGSNAVFVLFHTPWALNLSRARTNEADLDLYLSTDPALTNLDPRLFATTNLLRSVQRGGYEYIWLTNAAPGTTFYLGVKSEDQQAAEYGLIAGLFSSPEGNDTNGPITIQGYAIDIPDGSPDEPGGQFIVMVNPNPITIQNVVVTAELTHEFGGDLFGQLVHDDTEAVLNNHLGFSGTNVYFVWDDGGSLVDPDALPSDGPPTLRNFAGEEGAGVWLLTMVDNALFHTGRVESVSIEIEPQPPIEYFRNGFGFTATGSMLPDAWARYTVDVPADATNLTVCLQPANGPLDLYLQYGQDPTTNAWDHYILVDPNPPTPIPPNGCLTVTRFDSPPLRQGRYYIGLHNPNGLTVSYQLSVRVERDLRPDFNLAYRSTGATTLLDDAVTNSTLYVPDDNLIASVNVGVRIVHPRASDLVLHLVSPEGTRLLLAENRGGTSPDGYGFSAVSTNFLQATSDGGWEPQTNDIPTGFNEGIVTVDYNFYPVPDRMTMYYDGALIFDSDLISNSGTFEVPFGPGLSSNVVLVVNEDGNPNLGTAWDYSAIIVSGRYIYTTFTENTNLTVTPIKFGTPPFTNNIGLTNLNVPALVSDFETAPATNYTVGDPNFDGWNVEAGMVEVVQDPTVAHTGSNFLALANGSILRLLETIPGVDYRLTFVARDPGIVGWWAGESNATDRVYGNDGAVFGGLSYAPGIVGRAFSFDGINDHFTVPASPELSVSSITIEAWINPGANDLPRPLVEYAAATGVAGIHFWHATQGWTGGVPGALYCNFRDPLDPIGGSYLFTGRDVVPADTWTHVAVTFDDLTRIAHIYVQGVPVASTNLSALTFTPNTALPVNFGYRPSGSADLLAGRRYVGLMDEVSIYNRALTPTELAAVYQAGLVSIGKCSGTDCRPSGIVSVQGKPRTVIGSDTWRTNSFLFTANSTNTFLELSGNPLSLLLDTFELTPVRAPAYYLPEEPLEPLRGESTQGDWTLQIWDNRVGAVLTNVLLSWRLDFSIIATNPPAVPLVHEQCYTNTLAGDQIAYFVVSVPPAASIATNTLVSLTGGDLDLFYNRFSLPSGNTSGDTNSTGFGGGDVFLMDDTTDAEAVLDQTAAFIFEGGLLANWIPSAVLQPGRTYYLGVQNSDPTQTNDFRICLQFDRTGSVAPVLLLLTNRLAFTNCLAAGSTLDYYQFNASSNAETIRFDILSPSGDVDLYARRGPPLPTPTNFVYSSTNPGPTLERIELSDPTFDLTAGTWYLAVHNKDTNEVCYEIRATETLAVNVLPLTNGEPYTLSIPGCPVPDGTDYFVYNVSPNATWVTFDVYGLNDDANLVVKYELPLPDLTDYQYASFNPGLNDEQVMVLTNSFPTNLTAGPWYLGVTRFGLTNCPLEYTVLATEYTNPPPFFITITNENPITNILAGATFPAQPAPLATPAAAPTAPTAAPASVAVGTNTAYYRVPIAPDTLQANFEIIWANGNVDLYVKQGLPFPSPTRHAYAGTNAGTAPEFIAVATNSSPPLTPTDWWVTVQNTEPTEVAFALRVTQFAEPRNVTRLVSGVAHTNTATSAAAVPDGGEHYLFTVGPDTTWATIDLFDADADVDLVLRRGLTLPTADNYHYASQIPGATPEQLLVLTNSQPVPLAPGDWFLTVLHSGLADTNLAYTLLLSEFTADPPALVSLTDAVPQTNTLTAGGVDYYRFTVPTNAVQANFELLDLSGNVDLFLRPGLALPTPANATHAGTNAGTQAEFIAVATNSTPLSLTPGEWSVAVLNRDAAGAGYVLHATAFVPDTPALVQLTNQVDYTNTVAIGAGEFNRRVDYYLFNVESNAAWVSFDVFDPSSSLDLFVSRETPLPGPDHYDYASANPASQDEQVLLLTNAFPLAPGPWYLGVARTFPAFIEYTYRVRASAFTSAPPVITAVSNALPQTNTLAAGASQYFEFSVSPDAVQAHFELRDLSGNVDFFIRPGSSLPGPPDNYAYARLDGGTRPAFIAVATNSFPVPLAPGGWFISVVNRETNDVTFTLNVTEFVPETPTLVRLTNSIPHPGGVTAGTGEFNRRTDYYLFLANSNAQWATIEITDATHPVDLTLSRQTPLPYLDGHDYSSTNAGLDPELILLLADSQPVPLAPGPWFIGVTRRTAAVDGDVSYTVLAQEYESAPPAITRLISALPLTNTVPASGTNYYRFTVSPAALQANFELLQLSGNADLFLRPGSSLPGPANHAYAGTNSGPEGEFIALTPETAPVPLTPGDWFLAVFNAETNPVAYTIQATEFVPNTPSLVLLSQGEPFTNTIATGTGEINGRTDYFVFEVAPDQSWALIEVLHADAPVDLVVSRGTPLPTLAAHDYLSSSPGTNDEQVLITTNSAPVALAPGPWLIGVVRREPAATNISYTLLATAYTGEPPRIVSLANAIPFPDTLPVAATNYYLFTVPPGAVQANFELSDLTGNADLFIRPGSALPGPDSAAYSSENAGAAGEFIAVTHDATPIPLTPGDWSLAVVNASTNDVAYTIKATAFVPGTPTLVRLADHVPHPYAQITPGNPLSAGAEYYVYSVTTNAAWASFDLLAPSANVDLLLRRDLPLPTPAAHDHTSANLGTDDEQILLTPGSTPVPLAPGDWYLAVIRPNLAADSLSYQVRAAEFTNPPPVITELANALEHIAMLEPGESLDFRFTVSPDALQANFEVRQPTADIDLFIKPGLPRPDETAFAYASTNAGTQNEFIAVATNSLPTPLTPADWYLRLVNRSPAAAFAYTRVTEFVPGSTTLPLLVDSMPTNVAAPFAPGAFDDRVDYFAFAVPAEASYVTFDLLNPNANLDLLVRSSLPLPRPGEFDYRNANSGTSDEQILVASNSVPVPLTPGLWYVGVVHDPIAATDVTYTLRATAHPDAPPVITQLTNGQPLTAALTAGPGAVDYYRFTVPTSAVQADFELLPLTGNVDLFIRPWLPLPDSITHAYAGTNTGLTPEFISVSTNTLNNPVPLAPGDWYLAVESPTGAAADYTVRVTALPPVTNLLSGVPWPVSLGNGTEPVPDGIDYYRFVVSSNAAWAAFDILQPSADVTLLVTRGLPFPELDYHHYRSANRGTADEQVLVLTNSAPVPLTPGDWYLGVAHFGLVTSNLNYTVLATEYTAPPPLVVDLTSGLPITTNVPAASTNYYRFEVSPEAVQASFELRDLADNLDLFLKPGLPLPSPGRFDYASTNLGTADEWLRVLAQSTPAPLAPGSWFLAVVNPAPAPAQYTIRATEFVPGTPGLVRLTNGLPFLNTLTPAANPDHAGLDYFVFNVPAGANWATFDLLEPSTELDLVLRRELPLPTATEHDYRSANPGRLDDGVLVITNSTPVPLATGDWYLGVIHHNPLTTDVQYTLLAGAYASAPPIAADLTNNVPFANRIDALSTNYFRFIVSTGAVQAGFELFQLAGNLDLFLKPGLPRPHPNRHAYASTNAGTQPEWIVVTRQSTPAPLTAGEWFLAVVNPLSAPLDYTLLAREFVPGTPDLVRLTNGVPYTNALDPATHPVHWGVDYFVFAVPSGAAWVTFDLSQASTPVDLVLRRQLPLPTADTSDYFSANPQLRDEGILVATNSQPVPLAPGDWYLGVLHQQPLTGPVAYTLQATALNSAPPVIIDLANAVPADFIVPPAGTNYYRFEVTPDMLQVAFETANLDGNVDLHLKAGLPLPGPLAHDYAASRPGTEPEWIAVATNSLPLPLAPGAWFLAVGNRQSTAQTRGTVIATGYIPDTGTLIQLADGLPHATDGSANPFSAVDYFTFNVAADSVRAQFEVANPDSDVTLVLSRNLPLPTRDSFDYQSALPGTNSEWIVVYDSSLPVPLSAGTWYLGVVKLETNRVDYSVRFAQFNQYGTNLLLTRIGVDTGSLCLSWTNALPGAIYHLQATPTLTNPQWLAASPALTAAAPDMDWCLSLPTPFRFFRVAEGFPLQSSSSEWPPVELTGASATAGGMEFGWAAPASMQFEVHWAPTPQGPWQTVAGTVTSTNGLFRFQDDGTQTASPAPMRFYRVSPASP